MVVGMVKNGVLYNVYNDHLGTPRSVTDQSNTVVWQWNNSEAFGNNLPTVTKELIIMNESKKHYLYFGSFTTDIRWITSNKEEIFLLDNNINLTWDKDQYLSIAIQHCIPYDLYKYLLKHITTIFNSKYKTYNGLDQYFNPDEYSYKDIIFNYNFLSYVDIIEKLKSIYNNPAEILNLNSYKNEEIIIDSHFFIPIAEFNSNFAPDFDIEKYNLTLDSDNESDYYLPLSESIIKINIDKRSKLITISTNKLIPNELYKTILIKIKKNPYLEMDKIYCIDTLNNDFIKNRFLYNYNIQSLLNDIYSL